MSETPGIFGPVIDPENGNRPQQLVILCHGVGSDGNDLISLAPYFSKILPNARFIAPNAPEPFDMAPFGHQWFSLADITPEKRLSGVQKAAPVLDAFIDEQLASAGLQEKDMVLVGFSQGTMMALHVGLRRKRPLAGIIGYSGMLVGAHLLEKEMASKPPVLLVHGDADDVVPPESLDLAVKGLKQAGIAVEHLECKGLGHGLDDAAIRRGMEFLGKIFNVDLASL